MRAPTNVAARLFSTNRRSDVGPTALRPWGDSAEIPRCSARNRLGNRCWNYVGNNTAEGHDRVRRMYGDERTEAAEGESAWSKGWSQVRAVEGHACPRELLGAQVRLAQAAMVNRDTSVAELCRELDIGRVTLYRYVDANGK